MKGHFTNMIDNIYIIDDVVNIFLYTVFAWVGLFYLYIYIYEIDFYPTQESVPCSAEGNVIVFPQIMSLFTHVMY